MGKTAVFVLATLQQLEPKAGEISVVVMCHTRELAYQVIVFPALAFAGGFSPHTLMLRLPDLFLLHVALPAGEEPLKPVRIWRNFQLVYVLQICAEYERFKKAMPTVKVGNYFGGLPLKTQREELKTGAPNIVVGTPGRVKQVQSLLDLHLQLLFCHFE